MCVNHMLITLCNIVTMSLKSHKSQSISQLLVCVTLEQGVAILHVIYNHHHN